MPDSPANQEAEIGKIVFQGHLSKTTERLYLNKQVGMRVHNYNSSYIGLMYREIMVKK
jgi:hypothetical protein